MTREEIIEANPIITFIQDKGYQLKRSGSNLVTNACPTSEHQQNHNCVTIEPEKQLWHCNDCETGGTVLNWVMIEENLSTQQAMKRLGGDGQDGALSSQGVNPPSDGQIKELYNYTNESGKLLYQVVRYEPKSFRQRQPNGEEWQWNLDGISRVLYNLPRVLSNQTIFITEGERDADTLNQLGFIATTNCGGSSAWFDAYADFLKGRDVVVFPDNDKAGDKHYNNIVESIREKANSVKRVIVPKEFKDVSDWLATVTESERGKAVIELVEVTPHVIEPPPLYTAKEMEDKYREFVKELPTKSYSLASFCPQFNKISKRLCPGELVLLMGDTGVGKTAVMQAIAKSAHPLPTLFCELELPIEIMFQRAIQMSSGCKEEDVVHDYTNNTNSYVDKFKGMHHILTCDRSGITMDYIESLIKKSELKFGKHPVLVFVDYMGLVKKEGTRSRYEAMAAAAEQAKIIAKRTNTIVFIGSQVSRPTDHKGVIKEIGLHHAKGAGELENSANLVIGFTRPTHDKLLLSVLKNTRGPVGAKIEMDFNGETMQISGYEHAAIQS